MNTINQSTNHRIHLGGIIFFSLVLEDKFWVILLIWIMLDVLYQIFCIFFGKKNKYVEHPNEQNVGSAKFSILILLSALHHLKRIYEFQSKLKKRIWVTFVNEVEPGGHLLLTSSTVDQTGWSKPPRLPPQRCWTTIRMVVIIQLYMMMMVNLVTMMMTMACRHIPTIMMMIQCCDPKDGHLALVGELFN